LNRTINVNVTKNKKARHLPISSSLFDILEKYLDIRNGDAEEYLFGCVYNNRIAISTLQGNIKKYCNEEVKRRILYIYSATHLLLMQ